MRDADPEHDFSTDHYREIIGAIQRSHQTLSFGEVHSLGDALTDIPRFVIMRHDVELSVPAAVRLAEIDASEGVRSTFFLLQTSDYNPFEEEEAGSIRRILDLGHDIGLHYDAALLDRLEVDATAVVTAQVALFEAYFKTTVFAMSSHMPMRSGRTLAVPGVIDVYDPRYMIDIKYLSDSTQRWREGVVTDNLRRHDRIHLLTHEYIWHPRGWHWSALLFAEAHDKFQRMWRRAESSIDLFSEGLSLREQKDSEFMERYGGSNAIDS
ncbi:MAG: hypothetical protein OEW30_16215 [Acidimicrobiia bacterium]|nr:hypothetical protein [Acidimicrobiia bacterium]